MSIANFLHLRLTYKSPLKIDYSHRVMPLCKNVLGQILANIAANAECRQSCDRWFWPLRYEGAR